MLSEGSQVFLITLTMLGSAFLGWKLLGPLAQALARRLERRPDGGTPLAGQVEDLQQRVRDLEQQQVRMLELEERLDFTERLLVQARGAEPRRIDTPPEPVDALR